MNNIGNLGYDDGAREMEFYLFDGWEDGGHDGVICSPINYWYHMRWEDHGILLGQMLSDITRQSHRAGYI